MNNCDFCGDSFNNSINSCIKKQYITIRGEKRNRVKYSVDSEKERCPYCNVLKGGYHHKGCLEEICPICGKKFIKCSCKFLEKIDIPDYTAFIAYYCLNEEEPLKMTLNITKIKDNLNKNIYNEEIFLLDKDVFPNDFDNLIDCLNNLEDIKDQTEYIEIRLNNFINLVEKYKIKNIMSSYVLLYEDNNYEEFLSDTCRFISYNDYIRMKYDEEQKNKNRRKKLMFQINSIPKKVKIVKVTNYTREEYEKVKEIADDVEEFGNSYEEWLENAEWIREEIRKKGLDVILINVKAKNLKRFCEKRGWPINSNSRSNYVYSVTQY